MQRNISYIHTFVLLLFVVIFPSTSSYGQITISGPTQVSEGQTADYSFTGAYLVVNWSAENGQVLSTSAVSNGTNITYTATIQWICGPNQSGFFASKVKVEYGRSSNLQNANLTVTRTQLEVPSSYHSGMNTIFCSSQSQGSYNIYNLVEAIKQSHTQYQPLLTTWQAKVYTASSGGTLLATLTGNSSAIYTASAGTYYVSLVGTYGCESPRYAITYTQVTPGVPTLSTTSSTSFVGNYQTIVVNSVAGIDSYEWYKNGVWEASTAVPQYTITNLNTVGTFNYTVKCKKGTCLGAASSEIPVTTWSLPTIASFGGFLGSDGAPNLELRLTSTAQTGDSYQWQKDNVDVSAATNSIHVATSNGNYKLKVVRNGQTGYSNIIARNSTEINQNFVTANVILKEGVTSIASVDALAMGEMVQSTTYFDGLGRPIQEVKTRMSVSGQDMVHFTSYDIYGRTLKKYMPYTANSNDGVYKPTAPADQASFYGSSETWNTTTKRAQTAYPYVETITEDSHLGRPLEFGGIGESWQIVKDGNGNSTGTGKTSKSSWRTNAANEVRLWSYDMSTNTASTNGYYGADELWIREAKDENGLIVKEYSDKEARVIYKKIEKGTEILENYYVYDDLDRLRLMIPPKAVEAIAGNSWSLNGDILEGLCYQYVYDGKGRVIEKKIPDQTWIYIVYNERNQTVLAQDGKLRAQDKWTYTKYDGLNRPIESGIYTPHEGGSATRVQLQTTVNAQTPANLYEETAQNSVGYTNRSFPTIDTEPLSYTYYDSYDWNRDGVASEAGYISTQGGLSIEPVPTNRVLGQLIGTRVKVLGSTNTWLQTSTFYDKRGRTIQIQTDNHLLAKDISTTLYDFSSKVLETYQRHEVILNEQPQVQTIKQRMTYDHVGRLLETFEKLNSEPERRVNAIVRNEFGQGVAKAIGKDAAGNDLQKVHYRYNIQGRVTHVNNLTLSKENGTDPAPLFGMELHYESLAATSASGVVGRYDGNISQQLWKSALDGVQRQYNYEYDGFNRLKNATYEDNEGLTGNAKKDYFEGNITYDKNGNILSLERKGMIDISMGQALYGFTDKLTYSYKANSNKLENVLDSESDASRMKVGDFRDQNKKATTGLDDYSYDVNGSLSSDKNKNIASITYNHFEKVEKILLNNGNYIEYTYDAAGVKLRKRTVEINTNKIKTTDYVGGFIYENDKLEFVSLSEGKAVANYTSGSLVFDRQYFYTDHLGNLRMIFKEAKNYNYYTGLDGANDEGGYKNIPETKVASQGKLGSNASKTSTSQPVGVWKTLAASKGDSLKVRVSAKYTQNAGNNNPISIVPTITYTGGSGNGENGAMNLSNWSLGVNVQGSGGSSANNGLPKAELRAVLYDEQGNYLSEQYVAITSGAHNNWQELTLNWKLPANGLIQISVVNSSDTDVFFDDMTTEIRETMIVQETHYYPFGGIMKGIGKEGEHKFLYNGQTEREESFDIGLDETPLRLYDSQTGRFLGIDVLAEKWHGINTYSYALNNPVNVSDPSGADAIAAADATPSSSSASSSGNFRLEGEDAQNFFRILIGRRPKLTPEQQIKQQNLLRELEAKIIDAKANIKDKKIRKTRLAELRQQISDVKALGLYTQKQVNSLYFYKNLTNKRDNKPRVPHVMDKPIGTQESLEEIKKFKHEDLPGENIDGTNSGDRFHQLAEPSTDGDFIEIYYKTFDFADKIVVYAHTTNAQGQIVSTQIFSTGRFVTTPTAPDHTHKSAPWVQGVQNGATMFFVPAGTTRLHVQVTSSNKNKGDSSWYYNIRYYHCVDNEYRKIINPTEPKK